MEHVEKHPKELHPVLKDFQHAVETNTRLRMLFETMFDQVPHKPQYQKDVTGAPQVRR
jgi:phosphatidylserine decarboxylase